MSTDIQLAWPCPHLVIGELAVLLDDLRTLPTRQPIASYDSTGLWANDEYFIPRVGLYSYAKLKGSFAGPFNVIQNEADLIVVSSEEVIELTLPVEEFSIDADRFIELFQPLTTNIQVENDEGHIVLTDIARSGRGSAIQVLGTAAHHLGFDLQTGVRGRKVYPAWGVYTPPNSITERWIRFKEPITNRATFTLTYSTIRQRCLRCAGTGVENDYRHKDSDGDTFMVRNEDLLYQSALKLLLTDLGSNPYHPELGTNIRMRIGSKSVGAVAASISAEIQRTLDRLQTLQTYQGKFQEVTWREQLYEITSITTVPHVSDPTMFRAAVSVRNASGRPINLTIVYAAPGTASQVGKGLGAMQLGTLDTGRAAFDALDQTFEGVE